MTLTRDNEYELHNIWNSQVEIGDIVQTLVSGYARPILATVTKVYPSYSITVKNPYTNRSLTRSSTEYIVLKGFDKLREEKPELFI